MYADLLKQEEIGTDLADYASLLSQIVLPMSGSARGANCRGFGLDCSLTSV